MADVTGEAGKADEAGEVGEEVTGIRPMGSAITDWAMAIPTTVGTMVRTPDITLTDTDPGGRL